MRFLFFIIIQFYSLSIGFTQTERLNFKHISATDGLSNNWVRCIYQDDQGFMWFGTTDGVNRYNGYDFKIYRPASKQKEYIGDLNINAILNRSINDLWICTDIGVFSYNYTKDSLVYLSIFGRQQVFSILKTKEGYIWLGTINGLVKYDLKSGKILSYVHNNDDHTSLSNNYINTLFQDSGSNIWIGTRDGLNFMNKETEKFIVFQASEKPNSLQGNNITSICEDHNKRIWIGTLQQGLSVITKDKYGNIGFKKVLKGKILNLLVDSQNNLWVGKDSDGGMEKIQLNGFNINDKLISQHYQFNPIDPKSISDNSIWYIYEDKLKDIWIGTLTEGINYLSRREKKFNIVEKEYNNTNSISNNHVNTFYDDEDFLWIGTEGGLDRYDKKKGIYKHFKYEYNNPGSLGGDAIKTIYKDSRGNLWVGVWSGGLNLYNYNTGLFKKYLHNEKSPGSISNSNVYSICEDKRGNLWIGTVGGGLNRFDYKTGSFRSYLHDDKDPQSLSQNFVNYVFSTSSGKLYVSSYYSLEMYNYEYDNFTRYSFGNDTSSGNVGKNITSIFEDSKNNIWIAANTGLEIFDEKNNMFIPYNTNNGLPDLTIQGILEDQKGNLWICTIKGISKLDHGIDRPSNPVFTNFTNSDGLSGNEFIKRAIYQNNSGIMYFGSSKGFTYFHPDSILTNTIKPQVVLSEFMLLYSKGAQNNKYKSIIENINTIEKLDLSYLNSNFVISYASLNYLHPEKNQYQYKLEGYDEDWIDAGNQRSVSYTNIQPGRYTFIVKGSNNDGVWCQSPKTLMIVIHPPWWRTLLFKIFLVLVIVISIISTYYIRLSILKRQNAILEQKVKNRTNELSQINAILEERQEEITIQNDELERHRNHLELLVEKRTSELVNAKIKAEEADRLKTSFLANMSHEIRTPMNAIYGFSGLLTDESLSKEEKSKFVSIISDNCESLLVLIDDILDISRIEVDKLEFTNEKYSVDDILINLENFFAHNNEKDIEFKFVNKTGENGIILNNDKVRFRQVFINLLNNAYKFTESGHIKFGYEILQKKVRFFVSDTGIGIESSEIDKIFNHFYKIENNPVKLYRGTGLGLAICKKIVEMMGGDIWAESIVNKGSVFYFTLPNYSEFLSSHNRNMKKEQIKLNLKNFTILVAEDTQTNYELIESMLKPFKTKIIWAKNGQEAIDFIKSNPNIENCIVLMDIKMPVVDGYQANKQIKAINYKIPVIAVTAYAQKVDKERILNENFDDYISKPMKMENLLEALSKYSAKGNTST
jgi:signal transduction histidine kinase/ligand-binding sensor domain-containing protein/CheY-like chemotaxis protein